jgi:hypothetical protein
MKAAMNYPADAGAVQHRLATFLRASASKELIG